MHQNKSRDHEGNLITEMVGLPKELPISQHQQTFAQHNRAIVTSPFSPHKFLIYYFRCLKRSKTRSSSRASASIWTLLKAWCWPHIGEPWKVKVLGHPWSVRCLLDKPGESQSRTEAALCFGASQVPQALLEQGKIPKKHDPGSHSAPERSSIPILLHSELHLWRGPEPQ